MKKGFTILAVLFVILNTVLTGYCFRTGRVYNEWLLSLARKEPAAARSKGVPVLAKDSGGMPAVAPAGGFVTFRFDDAFESVYQNAFPILEEAGFPGVVGVITDKCGKPFSGYMSWEQVRRLEARGWEIASHSVTHPFFDELSEEEVVSEIRMSRETMLRHGIGDVSTFILPNLDSRRGEMIRRLVRQSGYEHFCSDFGVEVTNPDQFIPAITCETLSSDAIKGLINRAEKEGRWVVLLFHRIDHSGAEYSTPPEKLGEIVDYVKGRHIQVVTVREGARLAKAVLRQ